LWLIDAGFRERITDEDARDIGKDLKGSAMDFLDRHTSAFSSASIKSAFKADAIDSLTKKLEGRIS
jgi:hypothetical protein